MRARSSMSPTLCALSYTRVPPGAHASRELGNATETAAVIDRPFSSETALRRTGPHQAEHRPTVSESCTPHPVFRIDQPVQLQAPMPTVCPRVTGDRLARATRRDLRQLDHFDFAALDLDARDLLTERLPRQRCVTG